MGLEDVVTIGLVVMFIAIMGLFGLVFVTAYIPPFQQFPIINQTTWAEDMKNTFKMYDSMVGVAAAILMIGTIMLAFYAKSKPVLAVFAVFLQIFFFIISYFISQFFAAFSSANELMVVAAASFPISRVVMFILPLLSFIVSIGIIVMMYSRPAESVQMGV